MSTKPAAGHNARAVRLEISTSQPYTQIGRLWAGDGIQPGNNFDFNWSREWGEDSVTVKTPRSGLRLRDRQPRYRRVNLAFGILEPEEADEFDDGDYLAGTSGQILVCTDPNKAARTTLFGTPTQASPITQPYFDIFAKTYAVEEDL